MKSIKLFCLYLFLALTPFSSFYSQTIENGSSTVTESTIERYDNYLENEIIQNNLPGVVSMVIQNGKIKQKSAFGYSNLDKKTPMKIDDIFYIQSMTKPIISVAIMMLYEEGHFKLTDLVSKYIPEMSSLRVIKNTNDGITGDTNALTKEITISQLLKHTAGFTHGIGGSQLDKDFWKNQYLQPYDNIQDRVDSLLKIPLIGQPGDQWNYSAAPDIISILIEKFSGKSTNDFLIEKIFEPLGMEDTGYNLPISKQSRFVHLSAKNENDHFVNSKNQVEMQGNTIWSGVNALFSTAPDYLIFCQMLLNDGDFNGKRLLKQETVDLMTSNKVNDMFKMLPGHGFGYGFAITTDVPKSNSVGSEGLYFWCGLYNTHFFIDPKEKLIAIYMTQIEPFSFKPNFTMRNFIYATNTD